MTIVTNQDLYPYFIKLVLRKVVLTINLIDCILGKDKWF